MPLPEDAIKQFAKMTSKEIEMYEQQMANHDWPDKAEHMIEIQKIKLARIKEEEMQEEIEKLKEEKQKAERATRLYHLDKLNPYKNTPRVDSPFIHDLTSKPPFLCFNKAKWKEAFYHYPIIYAAVVQANSALWNPGDNEYLPAVFVFALDDTHRYDVDWLVDMASKIMELKKSHEVPEDCAEFIETLRNDQSIFCFKVGKSLAGDADLWCATDKIEKQASLPYKALPGNGVVPFLLKAQPKHQQTVSFGMIPAKYYE